MTRQTLVSLVKTEDPWDRVTVLNQELRDDNFSGRVVLEYECGVLKEAEVAERLRL